MGNETDQPAAAGGDEAARVAALAILLQRQNLLQIQQSLPAQRARLGHGPTQPGWRRSSRACPIP